MKSQNPSPSSQCACAHSPIVAALAAAFYEQTSSKADFWDEIDFRLRQAKHTAGFLAFTFDQADLHRVDFHPEHLHGVATLLLNELTIIECLHTALHETLNAGLLGEGKL